MFHNNCGQHLLTPFLFAAKKEELLVNKSELYTLVRTFTRTSVFPCPAQMKVLRIV